MIHLETISLAKYAGLPRMLAETEENIRNLRTTIGNAYHHPVYLALCGDSLKNHEDLLAKLVRAKKVSDEMKSFPIGSKFNFHGKFFTVSSFFIGEDGELWSGMTNGKGQVMSGAVKSWLNEITIGHLKPVTV